MFDFDFVNIVNEIFCWLYSLLIEMDVKNNLIFLKGFVHFFTFNIYLLYIWPISKFDRVFLLIKPLLS